MNKLPLNPLPGTPEAQWRATATQELAALVALQNSLHKHSAYNSHPLGDDQWRVSERIEELGELLFCHED